MIISEAKALASQWVRVEAAVSTRGFGGACYSGSVPWLPEPAELPATSDVDILLVADPVPERKRGKLRYQGVLLDVSYLPMGYANSPERVLADYHLAGSFAHRNVIVDPQGRLTRLQSAVAARYAEPVWIRRRCAHVRDLIRERLDRRDPAAPLSQQVIEWVFPTGQTTHLLLVAGLRNPTVRRRYVAVRELLAEQDRLDLYERLLDLLGAARLDPAQARHHLSALAAAYDDTAPLAAAAPYAFASDLTADARPVAIDGSRELIDAGLHREAAFWLVATFAKCQRVLDHGAAERVRHRHERGLRDLLADLGIGSASDLHHRARRVLAALPGLWTAAQQITGGRA